MARVPPAGICYPAADSTQSEATLSPLQENWTQPLGAVDDGSSLDDVARRGMDLLGKPFGKR